MYIREFTQTAEPFIIFTAVPLKEAIINAKSIITVK